MLSIYCDVALVSAFAERCFSVMRRIKISLRSNMRDNSPTDRMFSNIHKNLLKLDNINLSAVADDFASKQKTNKLFWVTVTLIVHHLIIDIKPQSKGPFMLITFFLLHNC